jgi:hypothetical protein
MKHELEQQLRRDARAVERAVPDRVIAQVRERIARESAPSKASVRARPLLAAALVLIAVGALYWAVRALSATRVEQPKIAEPTHVSSPSTTVGALALDWPSRTVTLATHAGEPLTREWANLKNDSLALVRGFERQLPLRALRN